MANQPLHALLRKWAAAAEDASRSTQQAHTFRRAAASVAAYPTPVTTREEALRVKHIGETLAAQIANWFDFEAAKKARPLQLVAFLEHQQENKWWSIHVCGTMARRSWGKRDASQNRPGMDNWERFETASDGVKWAAHRAQRQLTRGYAHAPGSDEALAQALDDVERQRISQAASSVSSAARPNAHMHAAPAGCAIHQPSLPQEACLSSSCDGSSVATTTSAPVTKRAYLPKLLNQRSGEVTTVAALLIAFHRAAPTDSTHDVSPRRLSSAELLQLAQPLCPGSTLAFHSPAPGRGGGRCGRGKGNGGQCAGGVRGGAGVAALKTLVQHGLVCCSKEGRTTRYELNGEVAPYSAAAQLSGAVIAFRLSEALLEKEGGREQRAAAAMWRAMRDGPTSHVTQNEATPGLVQQDNGSIETRYDDGNVHGMSCAEVIDKSAPSAPESLGSRHDHTTQGGGVFKGTEQDTSCSSDSDEEFQSLIQRVRQRRATNATSVPKASNKATAITTEENTAMNEVEVIVISAPTTPESHDSCHDPAPDGGSVESTKHRPRCSDDTDDEVDSLIQRVKLRRATNATCAPEVNNNAKSSNDLTSHASYTTGSLHPAASISTSASSAFQQLPPLSYPNIASNSLTNDFEIGKLVNAITNVNGSDVDSHIRPHLKSNVQVGMVSVHASNPCQVDPHQLDSAPLSDDELNGSIGRTPLASVGLASGLRSGSEGFKAISSDVIDISELTPSLPNGSRGVGKDIEGSFSEVIDISSPTPSASCSFNCMGSECLVADRNAHATKSTVRSTPSSEASEDEIESLIHQICSRRANNTSGVDKHSIAATATSSLTADLAGPTHGVLTSDASIVAAPSHCKVGATAIPSAPNHSTSTIDLVTGSADPTSNNGPATLVSARLGTSSRLFRTLTDAYVQSKPGPTSPCVAQGKRKVQRVDSTVLRMAHATDGDDDLQRTPSARLPLSRKRCDVRHLAGDVATGLHAGVTDDSFASEGEIHGVDNDMGADDIFLKSLPENARQVALSDFYDVCVLVDTHEKLSLSERADNLCERIKAAGLDACIQPLPVGDFLWVAVPRNRTCTVGAQRNQESGGDGAQGSAGRIAVDVSECLVLDCIVERKQVADFLSTIKSSRHYNSQKVRLRRCGLQRAFYLVEGALERWKLASEMDRMKLELCRIQMVDKLTVVRTSRFEETLQFISITTQRLRTEMRQTAATLRKMGALQTWNEFCAATSPPECVSHAFGRMLLNINGMTAPMVHRVLQNYPTPRSLVEAVDEHKADCEARVLAPAEAKWLLAEILEPGHRRKKMSETVTDFFS